MAGAFEDRAVTHASPGGAAREVRFRFWYPEGVTAPAAVVLVSHGGDGPTQGHTGPEHLAREYSAAGCVTLVPNHLPSSSILQHERDRPGDVPAVLDAVLGGKVGFPGRFRGSLDSARVGHAGHS